MPSFDPTQWAGLSSATSGDAGEETLAKTRTEGEHFAALLEAGEFEKAARFAANSPKQAPGLGLGLGLGVGLGLGLGLGLALMRVVMGEDSWAMLKTPWKS